MLGLDAINAYFVVVAMAALLVMVLVWQRHRSQRTVVVWLASAAAGVVLGSAGSYAGMRLAGYQVVKAPPPPPANAAASTPGMGGAGSPMAKGMPGMGGAACPMAKVNLTTLVQKLDLVTGITLTAEQAADVGDCLRDVETLAKMSNEDAKAKYHHLLSVLSEDQKARLGTGPGMGSMGGGMPGGPGQDAEDKAFKSLRERFASKGTAPKTGTPKAPPAKADAPRSPAAKS